MNKAKKQHLKFRKRRIWFTVFSTLFSLIFILSNDSFWQNSNPPELSESAKVSIQELDNLIVKGRAPKIGYSRKQFGDGWQIDQFGCDTRNRILKRDLTNITENSKCQVVTGTLQDPYTGQEINFSRNQNATKVQIDHVVALSDAWQKGAQNLPFNKRVEFANDPLNLLASEGEANQQKGDSDAASWLPSNKSFRCQYIIRQISIKKKYSLWVTSSEKDAMKNILNNC